MKQLRMLLKSLSAWVLVVVHGVKMRHGATPSPLWGRQSRREGGGEGVRDLSIGLTPLTLALSPEGLA